MVSYSTFIDPVIIKFDINYFENRYIYYLSAFPKYLMSNFNDLELTGSRVIRGQSSQCQLKTHDGFLSDFIGVHHHVSHHFETPVTLI